MSICNPYSTQRRIKTTFESQKFPITRTSFSSGLYFCLHITDVHAIHTYINTLFSRFHQRLRLGTSMASEDFSFESSYFMCAPPSPCRLSTMVSHHLSLNIAPPPRANAKQNLGSDSDDQDFQFNIGTGAINASSFESTKKKHGIHRSAESLPSVSFADELFCDGKVKALPSPSGCRIPAAVDSFPRSRRSPLTRRNSPCNDDFDPFVTALECVKEDNRRGKTKNQRRVQSASPFYGPGYHHQMPTAESKSPVQEMLTEPKDVDFSRRMRQVQTLANHGDNKRETKRQKMMRFFTMKSKSLEIEEDRDNHGSNRSTNRLLRRLSFNRSSSETQQQKKKKKKPVAMASTASATSNVSRAVSKVPVMQYRTRLLLCMGYGLRRSSYVK